MAVDVNITNEDLMTIDRLLKQYPIIGDRYSEDAMKMVNH